jgi:large subunit ribosomal protein L3
MALGLIGRKCGMTRIFNQDGSSVPVTVVHVEPNYITQIKNFERDGYLAVQVTTGQKKRAQLKKPEKGLYEKVGQEPGRGLWEFRVSSEEIDHYNVGSSLNVNLFESGQKLDVTGITKGKGFAGVIKRHNFSMQNATHGTALTHRAHGSTGQCQSPARVFKNKKMAGHMGNAKNTAQNVELLRVDTEKGLLLIKGSIPGANQGDLKLKPAVKFSK